MNELVAEFVLGVLPEARSKELAAAIASDPGLEREVRLGGMLVDLLADGLPAPPRAANARARLLATLSSPDRFKELFPILRSWFDLGDDELRAVLARADEGRSWVDAPFPGVRYFHFEAGPKALGKEAGCLTLAPGARFPAHRHDGTERSMILEGTLLLDDRAWHAGSVFEAAAGTAHELSAGAGRDLVLVVIHDGISYLGR